ncbi:putative MFS-type transporter YhjX [Thauera sp. GDN1]|uniref:MFS transporter n=1 Tax=Thauera sp. GDN1 TaxID=2944810 RepID=UPI002479038C|nr:MFS transporter [Thauera sp. GDN1]WEN43081.1 putative MFS-type transporter YhjX [Thauera sp. GDN1]
MSTQNLSFLRRPIVVMVCGALILTLSMGVRHTGGLFLQPMTLDQGWSRELFSFSIALQNLLWGLFQPFAGAFADRHGAGRTLVGGALLYILGLVIMAHADSALGLNVGAGLFIGMGLAGTTFSVVLGVIGRMAAPEKRSMALGLASAGGSFGQFAVLPVGQGLIAMVGWQDALLWLAFGIALIVPLAAAVTGTSDRGTGVQQSLRQALNEAMRTPSFHYLFWSFFVCGFQTAFIMLHLPAFVVDSGMSANIGMTAVALIGLFNIFGSFLSGWLGGCYSKKGLLAGIYALRIVAILALLLFPLSQLTLYLFAAVMGLLWLGTVPLTSGLVGHIFGLRYMGMLYGIVFLGHQIGGFLGAWLGGRIFDLSGSYLMAWWLSIALSVMAAALSLPVREAPLLRTEAR